jgi:hypothetical protein
MSAHGKRSVSTSARPLHTGLPQLAQWADHGAWILEGSQGGGVRSKRGDLVRGTRRPHRGQLVCQRTVRGARMSLLTTALPDSPARLATLKPGWFAETACL